MEPNPYESPRTERCSPVTSGSSLAGSTATFTVYTPQPHEVEVYFSHWSGLETATVDGVERFRLRSFAFWGTRRIPLDDGHGLTLRFSWFPFGQMPVDLDGARIIDDLFPRSRRLSWALVLLTAIAVPLIVVLLLTRGHPVEFLPRG